MGRTILLKPSDIHYTHNSISWKFSDFAETGYGDKNQKYKEI